jgi:glutaredoxin
VIDLYTRPSCSRCMETKKLLSTRGIKFVERVLDYDVPTSKVAEMFPGCSVLPILAVGEVVIAGLPELETLIELDQLKYLISREPETNAG